METAYRNAWNAFVASIEAESSADSTLAKPPAEPRERERSGGRQASRRIDLEIDFANGPRSIGDQVELAKRCLDDRIATILCADDSGNEAIVLRDEHGTVRVHEYLRGGNLDEDEVAALIEAGIDPAIFEGFRTSEGGAH